MMKEGLAYASLSFFYGTPVPIRASSVPNHSKLTNIFKVFVEMIMLKLFSMA